ncbi:MAG: VOC family protein [Lacipirellulaceae bacterium]
MKTGKPSEVVKHLKAILIMAMLLFGISVAILSTVAPQATAQQTDAVASSPQATQQDVPTGKVIGIKYNCVHVLKLEQTLKLYREILGFKLVDAEILHGEGIEGMLVMKLQAGDCNVYLSLTAPEYLDTIGEIGNTNHNHFMLLVDNIVPICDKLKEEGYELENEAYARDKYSFFTGPNGEIIGLTEYK